MPNIEAIVREINLMKATTELNAWGTWQDPKGGDNDLRTDNVILEIEYGEIEDEAIDHGNNLEINEEILYGRMGKIEQSTLVS